MLQTKSKSSLFSFTKTKKKIVKKGILIKKEPLDDNIVDEMYGVTYQSRMMTR